MGVEGMGRVVRMRGESAVSWVNALYVVDMFGFSGLLVDALSCNMGICEYSDVDNGSRRLSCRNASYICMEDLARQ
jgi:hypothetical protein